MERITFEKLNAVYQLNTKYSKLKTEDYNSSYSCMWEVNAQRNTTSSSYVFIMDRKEVRINGKPVEKLMDRVVYEMGSALYPVRLEVTGQMEPMRILNYEEILERRKAIEEKCRKDYPGDVINRYIKHSEKYFSKPRVLLLSLYNDSFIKLYFRNLFEIPVEKDVRERVDFYNFPLSEMKSSYYCTITKPEENKRKLYGPLMAIIPGQDGQAQIEYSFSPQGNPVMINGVFTAKKDLKEYRKKIDINLQGNTDKK